METELLGPNAIPEEQELVALLGERSYAYYQSVCKTVVSLLSPDREIWDHAGRRGKYYHGYRVNKGPIAIDLYLSSLDGQGWCLCEFILRNTHFNRIRKQQDYFGDKIRRSIDETMELKKKHGGTRVAIRVNEDSIQDVLKVIDLLSSPPSTR